MEALVRPGGCDLNLENLNIALWWQGYSGLKLINAEKKFKYLKTFGPTPSVILIHCGANDIRQISVRKFRVTVRKLTDLFVTSFQTF